MTSPTTLANVQALLVTLRDTPVDNASDVTLATILEYLMGVTPQNPQDGVHWFCRQATPITIDAATFLIRLFAYQSDNIIPWKTRLQSCLGNCADCVLGFERVKVTSKGTFFGAFSTDVLRDFYDSFEQWEVEAVLEDLTRAGLSDQPSSSSRTLADAKSAIVYRMMSNWTVFRNPKIQSVINAFPPAEALPGWPTDPPPPGMFVLLIHENPRVRGWALSQASKCIDIPPSPTQFLDSHMRALEAVGHAFSPNGGSPFLITPELSDLWHGFRYVLRHTPNEMVKSNSSQNVDLRRIVVGHVHDTGPHFESILRSLALLPKRLGGKLWEGEGPEFPQVVFDSMKDNSSLSQLLMSLKPSDAESAHWLLGLFVDILKSLKDLPGFGEVLAKTIDFLCEETQHERFKDVRPVTMNWALRVIAHVLRRSNYPQQTGSPYRQAAMDSLNIHSETILGVAFSRTFDDRKWEVARATARGLVRKVLEVDGCAISDSILQLCQVLVDVSKGTSITQQLSSLSPKRQMWAKLYSMVQSNDIDGIALLIRLVAQTAHIDLVNASPYAPAFQAPQAENLLRDINKSLGVIRDGFLATISKFRDHNVSTTALELLRRPDIVKDVTILMLSPVEDIQDAAQILVGLAFDVDARQECFRALLENLPDAAFQGIISFLDTFTRYAPLWPEACSLSKSLVRCFTDIIEVLCTTPNGLLHSQYFLQSASDKGPASELPKLWSLMAESLSVIFKRTPLWSKYFESETMVVWMRDALIFGRDMLAKWRTIESAANSRFSSITTKPGELSSLGKKMMEPLQKVLLELSKWLRLTDEELLHQAFSLLTSLLDCFHKANILPKEENLKKLRKHIDNARAGDADLPRTRLDTGRLLLLEVALDNFESNADSETQKAYVVPKLEQKSEPKSDGKAIVQKQKMYIQGGTSHKASGTSKAKLPAAKASKVSKSISRFFSDKDQETLDSANSLPSFRVSSKPRPKPVGPAPSRPIPGTIKKPSLSAPESSESEHEDEKESDENDEGGLASISKMQSTPKVKKPPERRSVKTIDIPTHSREVDNERQKRRNEARVAAARLKPDISGLHKTLLSWDYNHTGPTPPGEKASLSQVPDKFVDFAEYEKIFRPLLLLECWAQIVDAKEKTQEILDCRITSRQFTDAWLDIDISVDGNLRKDWYLSETDVVLLKNTVSKKCIMAKTQSYRSPQHQQEAQATLRCFLKDGDPGLQINTKWQVNKLFSLTTLHREYAALVSVRYYDLANIILQPRLSHSSKPDLKDVEQAMSSFGLNEPQANAIISSLRTDGFTLIQGPPGTGKTSTICGLVAAALAKRPRAPVPVLVGRTSAIVEKTPAPKILICAPSNAAIDEIASRLHAGFRGSEKQSGPLKIVRLGAVGAMNSSVLDISLDSLVEQKLDPKETQSKEAGLTQISALRRDVEAIKQLISGKHLEKNSVPDNSARNQALTDEISQLNGRRAQMARDLNHLRDKQKADSRGLDALRRKMRLEVLREADVICSTLSGAAHESLEQVDFEMVIIDEAAQAIELSSLIPLKYRFNRCIMVGDPKQLPPTVLSKEACQYRYNESLFVRLQKQRPDAVHLLSIQYRMHPEISVLPSRIFYQGKLLDGPGLDLKTKQPWQNHAKFGTYRFFNVSKGIEEFSGHSIMNRAECEVAVALYSRLRLEFSNIDLDYRVGIVSMYKAQVRELRRHFEQRLGKQVMETVDFNTVDGFQGQEKDVIILSCVRAGPGLQSVGFLSDNRRMNVALTRAKSSLFILGNASTLERSDPTWRDIVVDARSRTSLVDTDATFFTRPISLAHRSIPSKTTKVVPTPPVPIPTDLVALRDFATPRLTSESPKVLKTSSIPHSAPLEPLPSVDFPAEASKVSPAEKPPKIAHRPDPPAALQPQANSIEKPRAPPIKRPKQPNIFIPKTKKRPPEDNPGGPSNRRKLS